MSKELTTSELDELEKQSSKEAPTTLTTAELDELERAGEATVFKPSHVVTDFSRLERDLKGGNQESPTFGERALSFGKSLLPDWRTAAQVTGAMVGGALGGPLGMVPGASIGESAYQIGQYASGSPEAPQSPEESAAQHTSAIAGAMIGEGVPALARYHAENPIIEGITRRAGQVLSGLKTPSRTLITRGLNPSDRMFQKHVDAGLSELKAAERTLGPIENVEKAQQGLDLRTTYNNDAISKIVKPQETIVVPGSGQTMANAQIAAIPDDIKNNPRVYSRVVRDIRSYHPNDFTIGELNTLRSELGATQSTYYGKDLSGQLTMDAGTRAADIARGKAARGMFYNALDTYGLGGGEAAAEYNSRIGSIIHYKDALMDQANKAVAERQPALKAVGSKIVRPFSTRGVDNNLALALKRWDKPAEDVAYSLEPRVRGVAGAQVDLLPSDIEGRPLLQPPLRTSEGIGETATKAQIDAARAQRAAPPATVAGTQGELQEFPGPLGREGYYPKGEYLSPEDEYKELMHQRRVWAGGAKKAPKGQQELQEVPGPLGREDLSPKGEYLSPEDQYREAERQRKIWAKGLPRSEREIKLPKKGQQDLQKGIPPKLFGIGQTIDPKLVPPGTKLAFETKMLDGTKQYHYQTPDGAIFVSDRELNLKPIQPPRPYEPGSSWRGNPNPTPPKTPTPPPKRTSRRKT